METPRPQSSSSKLVLLVDDNRTHQYSLGKHLMESDFEVIHAHTGSEALDLAAQRSPDVILLDIHLPDVSGFEVCQSLKARADTKSIPVIFHSATYDTQAAKSLATDLGADSFLSYPIDFDHLLSVIRGAIVRRQTHS